jgi:hypothetical protein
VASQPALNADRNYDQAREVVRTLEQGRMSLGFLMAGVADPANYRCSLVDRRAVSTSAAQAARGANPETGRPDSRCAAGATR